MEDSKPFEEWAIIELFGHRKIAGKVTESTICGGGLLRVDIPDKDGKITLTQFYGPSAIYSMTPTTETTVRQVTSQFDAAPVSRWELPQLPLRTPAGDGDGE